MRSVNWRRKARAWVSKTLKIGWVKSGKVLLQVTHGSNPAAPADIEQVVFEMYSLQKETYMIYHFRGFIEQQQKITSGMFQCYTIPKVGRPWAFQESNNTFASLTTAKREIRKRTKEIEIEIEKEREVSKKEKKNIQLCPACQPNTLWAFSELSQIFPQLRIIKKGGKGMFSISGFGFPVPVAKASAIYYMVVLIVTN